MASPGARSGNVTTRFPDVKGPKQVSPKDPTQFKTKKGNK